MNNPNFRAGPPRPIPNLTDAQAKRFWSRVDKQDGSGCWMWTGKQTNHGHGSFHIHPVGQFLAHRIAYAITKGGIPAGLFACHRCDNRLCVNPAHIFFGTHHDNMSDCASKGRHGRGERNGNSKLTREQVEEIRRDHRPFTNSKRKLAKKYGVSPRAIDFILQGRNWTYKRPDPIPEPDASEQVILPLYWPKKDRPKPHPNNFKRGPTKPLDSTSLTSSQIASFNTRFVVGTPNECWQWKGALVPKGYGQFSFKVNGRCEAHKASRIAYALAYGRVPSDKFVLHRCDNPGCVNPSHLFLGTQLDNISDRRLKDRAPRGSRNVRSKLTDELVTKMRRWYSDKYSISAIAARAGITPGGAALAIFGKTWAHVPGAVTSRRAARCGAYSFQMRPIPD